ncbi:sperm-associated antigen 6-like [Periplaneta americana]|uniref:sperm-associated antigen 6-like n=1 Tax=Periplaneta americana TaxID=6978 RepID=UPI0037E70AFD
MTAKIILQAFNQYRKARMTFVQTIADLSSRPHNIEYLVNAGVLDLLRPLLSDVVPTIQQTAAVALGRLANHELKLAQAIVGKDFLPQLLRSLDTQNKFYKKSALFVLRAISKHSPDMAQVVVKNGGLDAMVVCLEDFDPGVKEAAAWALGYVARHNRALGQAVSDAGAVPLLVLCLQERELCLKQVSASALCDISKHSLELAQIVVDTGAIPFLAKAVTNPDPKLKRQVLAALTSIAKHSLELAEMVLESEILPDILVHLGHPDELVKRNAATLVREITKHTLELSQLVVNSGGIGALLEFIGCSKGSTRLPGVMAIGYIAAHSKEVAMAVIASQGVVELTTAMIDESEDHVISAIVWALGQIGKHTPEHAKSLAVANTFPTLLQMYLSPESSQDLKQKCRLTLKLVLQKCMVIQALDPLLYDAPPTILKYVVGQYSKILPNDPKARRLFVKTGGLKKIQEIQTEPGTKLMEYITIINYCFPKEIVRYYSPGYPETLLEHVELYMPQIPAIYNVPSSRTSDDNVNHDDDVDTETQ